MKKSPFLVVLAFSAAAAMAAPSPQLVKLWETETSLKKPESVLFDPASRLLYVSNIDGKDAWAKDGKGSIGKVGLDGKVIAVEWVTGLEAPKGMALHQGKLYVADIDRVVVIDVAKEAIVERIKVEGAQGLNDLTMARNGVLYVTDSKAMKVFSIKNGKSTQYLGKLKRPNGILAHGGKVYVLDQGTLLEVDKDRSVSKVVTGMEPTTDGIEHVQGNEFVVTSWSGVVYYIAGREKRELLDTREQKKNAADIGYDAKKRIVYVPTFSANTVAAYELR